MKKVGNLLLLDGRSAAPAPLFDLPQVLGALGALPFAGADATAGSETELQAVVAGRRDTVDLPLMIEASAYFANIVKRARSGDAPERLVTDLERFLQGNREQVWENSWVRFPRRRLCALADQVLRRDLLADKRDPDGGLREDAGRFFTDAAGDSLRVPVSYLVKLALADAVGRGAPPAVRATGVRLLDHFLSDNTSPETFSFHVVPSTADGLGRALARETARRFLLTHLLTLYANTAFDLQATGQRAMIYFAPHPPLRQKELNEIVPDAFYRELFMSPCLSGWDEGEKKHRYMQLCHQVLGRSQLNAVAKLREAGIITSNLVVLPNLSNTSLANNGTHVSIGSRLLAARLGDPASGFTGAQEKYAGDLAIKIIEHFLPLFVGTCSGAPFRLGFTDFHPEKALGFLPHQLDYTHLRMLWRRWRKKASLAVCGRALTPFGPPWLDRGLSRMLRLPGDHVPDFRLVDYPVGLLSTAESPALDGRPGNQEKLKRDLADMGVFDPQMSLYLPFRQREFAGMGFSGFEGRHYSLFPDLEEDLAAAADLQLLVQALAFRYMATGQVTHASIPDTPAVESERRQPFFGAAIGIPTFFVRRDTGNLFLHRILSRCRRLRPSRRYPGYLRVLAADYRLALLTTIAEDGADLVEALGMAPLLDDLRRRLEDLGIAAADRLTREILVEVSAANPLRVPADEFNRAAERYYRDTLRPRHVAAACDRLAHDLRSLPGATAADPELRHALAALLPDRDPAAWFESLRGDLLAERLPAAELRRVIGLVLLTLRRDCEAADLLLREPIDDRAPVYRAG